MLDFLKRCWGILFLFPIILHAQSIIISEIQHSPQKEGAEFIELYNTSDTAIDLANWRLVGGVDYIFEIPTLLDSKQALVIVQNQAIFQSYYDLDTTAIVLGNYKGRLDGSGETLKLLNVSGEPIDQVHYKNNYPWKTNTTTHEKSLQLINPQFDNRIGVHWAMETPSPCTFQPTGKDDLHLPIIKEIRHSPKQPQTANRVRVRANVRHAKQVYLAYQQVEPGNYIALEDSAYYKQWTYIPMLDDGKDGDALANDRIYTAWIPSGVQQHRHLVRYRVIADGDTITTAPYVKSAVPNFAYYTYDGLPSYNGYNLDNLPALPVCQLIAKKEVVQHAIYDYEKRAYPATGTVVYNGKVYDHIGFRSRGYNNRHSRTKRNLKFNFHSHQKIKVMNDKGKFYKTKRDKLVLSGGWLLEMPNTHGLAESVLYRLFTLQGASASYADYTHLRVVCHENEQDSSHGDFWGLYLSLENYDGDFLKTHKLPDGNVYSYKPYKIRHHSYNNIEKEQAAYAAWDSSYHSSHSLDWWQKTIDWEHYMGFLITNEIIGNRETGYRKQHWWMEYRHPEKGWQFFPWDMDKTWTHTTGKSTISYSIYTKAFEHEVLEKAYKNQLRSVLDLLYNEEQMNRLINEETALIYNKKAAYNWVDLDQSRWGHHYDTTFQVQIDYLKNFVRKRRSYILKRQLDDVIPTQPSVVYTGEADYIIDQLHFEGKLDRSMPIIATEWRVATMNKKYQYEITAAWQQEYDGWKQSITLPDGAVRPNQNYRLRVRVKDTSGYYSHWSKPLNFIPKAKLEIQGKGIVFNELFYSVDNELEFIELYNNSPKDIALDGFSFSKGIRYAFLKNTNLGAYSYCVLTNDTAAFYKQYGFRAQGQYQGHLAKKGEELILCNAYHQVIDSLNYRVDQFFRNKTFQSWSMELLDSNLDNALVSNWQYSQDQLGTPSALNGIGWKYRFYQQIWGALCLVGCFVIACGLWIKHKKIKTIEVL